MSEYKRMYRSVNVIEESSPLGCHTLALFVLDIGERLNVIKFGHRLSVTDLLYTKNLNTITNVSKLKVSADTRVTRGLVYSKVLLLL